MTDGSAERRDRTPAPRRARRVVDTHAHWYPADWLKLFEREAFLGLPYFDHMHRYLPALMQRAGWKTLSVPVNHRPRGAGVSKYNNLQRAWVGLSDLRGVAWLIKRSKRTAVEEI